MATKHDGQLSDKSGVHEQLIRDLDLAILTDDYLYDNYRSGIRMEYSDISDEVYVKERIKVLNLLLKEVETAKKEMRQYY